MLTPKISVVQVTNRYGGFDVAWYSLKRQTFRSFEVIIHDTLFDKRHEELLAFTKNDPRLKHTKQTPKDQKAVTWLAHAENEALKQAQGELIVLLQDFIYIQPDALEKFWLQYQTNNKLIVSGVGHQYGNPGKNDIVNSTGLTSLFSTPFRGVPSVCVWKDPRMFERLMFGPCHPIEVEFNFCAIPYQALIDVGGCDESYDYVGFAFDNCSVVERAAMLGYQPYIDLSNECYAINSDSWSKSRGKDTHFEKIAKYHYEKLQAMRMGVVPIKLNYL